MFKPSAYFIKQCILLPVNISAGHLQYELLETAAAVLVAWSVMILLFTIFYRTG